MGRIETAYLDLGSLDALAYRDSAIHRLDPRAKLVTTLIFIVTVVSFDKYSIAAMLPFLLYPAVLTVQAGLPAGPILKKLLIALPFAFFIGIFNPFFDQATLLRFGTIEISGGWVSFASILLRFSLTVTAALTLIATTSFAGVCMALEKLGCPKIFALQLLFVYRYLFVLIEEATRLVRARALRSFHGRGKGLRTFGSLIGQLLLRTLERAQRIHLAMLCRGFDGEIRMIKPLTTGRREIAFVLGWTLFFVFCRLWNIPEQAGSIFMEILA
ncbi:MAG: cobalt ECF transporter T component CbiQ [Desulfuromonas sp.]|nr:MAG: cobalt ECF transporter T component CbiQ [Desulfuromonas sp.]